MTQYVARGIFALYRTGVRSRVPVDVSPRTAAVLRSLFVNLHYLMMSVALVLFVLVTHAAFTVHHFQPLTH
jgi:hypothetical protein